MADSYNLLGRQKTFGSRLLPQFDEFFSGYVFYENFLFSWPIYFCSYQFYLLKSQNSLGKKNSSNQGSNHHINPGQMYCPLD